MAGILVVGICRLGAINITPVLPLNGATDVTNHPVLAVHLAGTSQTDYTVTFYGRPSPSLVRSNFTIIALPDTQFYAGNWDGYYNNGSPATFVAQTDWIVANRAASNIVYVAHLGDCVLNGDYIESEWWAATNAMYRLEDPATTGLPEGIPYGVAVGNHDKLPWIGTSRFYNQYFGTNHFAGRAYYGGNYSTNNDNHFSLFSASGVDFVVIDVEFDPRPDALAWANSVMAAYRDRHAILVSHSILNPGYGVIFTPEGTNIYNAVKGNTNLFLMLCGHAPPAGNRTDTYNGHTIRTLLSDYTNQTNGGNGWLRVMEFSPSNNVVNVKTYSPTLNAYFPDWGHHFTLPYNLSISNKGFSVVATLTNVGPGFVSAPAWANLAAYTNYEWYVTVTNGTGAFTSSRWQFTTRENGGTIASNQFEIVQVGVDMAGHASIIWRSRGSRRYRVEYCDGDANGGYNGVFTELVRPTEVETDPSPPEGQSFRSFTDDYSLTGGPPAAGARYFRIRQVE